MIPGRTNAIETVVNTAERSSDGRLSQVAPKKRQPVYFFMQLLYIHRAAHATEIILHKLYHYKLHQQTIQGPTVYMNLQN